MIAWLGQEADRTGLHGAHPHVFIGIGGEENNWEAMTLGDQPLLQVKAAQSRHMQIGDEARCSAERSELRIPPPSQTWKRRDPGIA